MAFYALTSPNNAALSDNVIGCVVQRTWAARSRKEHVQEMPLYNQQLLRHTPNMRTTVGPQTISPHARDDVIPTQTALTSGIKLKEQTGSSTGLKFRSSDLETANQIVSTIQAANHSITGELQAAVVVEALKKKIQHRERCRVNQARYRQRQLKVKTDIQDGIAKLQVEIKELEERCQDPSCLPMTPTIWILAAEYFRHFRHYLSSPASVQAATANFLRGMLAPDAVDASSSGVEAQIENWRLFALYFGDADLELNSMNMPTPDTLIASTIITVTITSNTLQYAFPHLNGDGNGGAQKDVWSSLAAKMLGQKLVMHSSVTFRWDNSSGQVVGLQTRADLLTPMLTLLGNLESVSYVFEKAMITPDCQFVRRQ